MNFDPANAVPEPTFDPTNAVPDDGPPVKEVLRQAAKVKPDTAAEVVRLAKRYPVPREVIQRNFDDWQLHAYAEDADNKVAGAPKLAGAMRKDPLLAELAHDDIEPLAKIESGFAKTAAASAAQAVLGISEGIWRTPDAAQRAVGYLASTVERTGLPQYLNPIRGVQDVLQLLSEGRLPVGPKLFAGTDDVANKISDAQKILTDRQTFGDAFADVQTMAQNADKALATAVQTGDLQQLGQVITDPSYWAAFLSQAAPSLYAAMKSGGSVAFMGWLEGMEQASNAAEFEQKTGQKISDADFTQAFAQTALVNSLLEKFGLDKVLGAKGNGLMGLAKAMAGEGGTEALQQINSNLAALFAYNDEQSISEGVLASLMGGVGSGGALSATQQAAERVQQMTDRQGQEKRAATEGAKALAEQMKLAGGALLRERSPEQFRALMAEMTDGSIHVDGEVLNQLPPEVLNQLPESVRSQIADAAAANTTVEIPMADVLTVAPGTPLEQVLNDHARMDPFAPSLADTKVAAEKAGELLKQEAQRVIQQASDQEAMQASADAVKANILGQLQATGRFREAVNEGYATWASAFYTAYGSRMGMSPEQFYQRYPLRILGAPSTAPSAGQGEVMDQPGNTKFDAWFGDSKVVDAEGKPLVVYHGTDEEFTAFDVKKMREGRWGKQFYFTDNPEKAKAYGKYVMPVYLSITSEADGRIVGQPGNRTFMVGRPEQIKSATGNNGNFDPQNPSILEQSASEYQGAHKPPGPDSASLADLTGNGVYPDDVYGPNGARWYGDGSGRDAEAFALAQRLKGRPNATVTIYRAVPYEKTNVEKLAVVEKQIEKYMARRLLPAGVPLTDEAKWYEQATAERDRLRAAPEEAKKPPIKINPGDWVTLTRDYAREHGEGALDGNYKIISKKVLAKEVFTNGDSIQEWGYWPADTYAQDERTPAGRAPTPRGTFNPRSLELVLNPNANLSTFFHETGHFFLEVMADIASQPNPPAQIAEDMATFTKWCADAGGEAALASVKTAVDTAEATAARTKDPADIRYAKQVRAAYTFAVKNGGADYMLKVAQTFGRDVPDEHRIHLIRQFHERWAESIEQYVMEGKAPSVELQPLMRRFSAWLKSVYGSIKQFLAQRGVPVAGGDALNQVDPPAGFQTKVVGADGKPAIVYHGTGVDIQKMKTTGGPGKTSDTGAFFSSSPDIAATYATGENPNVVPVYLALKTPLVVDAGGANWNRIGQKARVEMPEITAATTTAQEDENLLAELEGRAPETVKPTKRKAKKTNVRELFKGEWDYPDDTASTDDIARWARKQGYDGLIVRNVMDHGPSGRFATEDKVSDIFVAFYPEQVVSSLTGQPLAQDGPQPTGPALQLNDDIRRVMDRMLATDEQIAQANEVAGLVPDENADALANERLRKRSIADLKWSVKARDKAIAALRKQAASIEKGIREAVTAEVNQMPEVQAKEMLAKTRKENGGELNDTERAIIADAFSYESVDAMLKAIDAFGSKKDVIDGMTEQRMLEEHGDLVDERAIQEAANEAVHNEARARSLATELRTQAEMLGARSDTGQTNAKGSKITVNALVEAAKQFAANVVSKTALRDLKARAWQHTAAERRAAKRWTEATAAGKTEEAVKAKQDQMLNHAAAKAAIDAKNEAQKILDFFRRVAKGNNETVVEKGRDPDIVNAARAVLAAYGVETPTTKAAAEYLDTLKSNDPDTFSAVEPMMVEAMQNAQPLDALTFDQLLGLHEQIEAMWHLAKRSRQMEVDGDLMDVEDVADEVYAKLEEIGIPDTIPGESGAVTDREQNVRRLQFARALLRRVEQWAEGLDGKFGGPLLRYIFQPVKDAGDRYRTDRLRYRKKFQALVDNVAPLMTHQLIAAPELGYTFGKGHNGIGHAELLHAILHTGNESNKRKLLLGRGWASENADGTLDTSRWDALIKRLSESGVLSPAHYDFAQGVWDLLEETKPLAQKTHRDVFGRYFAEVTADAFVDPFGVTRSGGYVPAQADPEIVADADTRALAEMENESMAYSFPSPGKGFTKSRVEYNRPLKLDLRTIPQHIDKVLLFSHMTPAVRGVTKLLRQKKVSQPLGRIDPAAYSGMLLPWLNRSARQQVETPIVGDGRIAKVLTAIRNRAGAALMFANISNTIQQITGLSGAAIKVRPALLVKSAAAFISAPRQTAAAVAAASPYMADRMTNEVAAMNDEMEKILLNPSAYERAQSWTRRHAYFLQSAFDNTLSPIVWAGAYNQALEDGLDPRMAVRFADGVVRQTQGTTLPEDVSRIESGPPYARVFTQFVSYFNMMANTNGTALQQIAREVGLKKGAGKALYVVTLGMLVPLWTAEAIAQAFRGGPDDEDDDGYLDDWLAAVFGMGTIKGVLAQVPFIGQLANAGLNRLNNNPADDKVSLSPAVSLLEASVGAPVSVYKAIVEDGNQQKAIRDVASLVSIATGLPATAVARPLGYAAGVAQGKIEPTGPVDAARGLVTGVASPASK